MPASIEEGGLTPKLAKVVAALAISVAEGAVTLTRAEQDLKPFDLVASEVVAATVSRPGRRSRSND